MRMMKKEHPVFAIAEFTPALEVLPEETLERINQVKFNALASIEPSKDEIIENSKTVDKVIAIVKDALLSNDIPFAFIEPQGSTGTKQTQLSGDSDVDLFIGVRKKILGKLKNASRKKQREFLKQTFTDIIQNIIMPSLKKHADPKKMAFSYAEHPYLTSVLFGREFDIVFCFNLDDQEILEGKIVTAMDRTPFHSKFVRNNLTLDQRNDVRLLKAFFKANHVYGDKSPVGQMGFIGYCLELLVYHFGTMENVMVNLEAIPSNPLDYFHREKEVLESMNRFSDDFWIVIDPTDKNRNVGSSMDPRCFHHGIKKIEEFLKNPAKDYFIQGCLPAPLNDDPHYHAVLSTNQQLVHYTVVRDKLYRICNMAKSQLEQEQTGEQKYGPIDFAVVFNHDDSRVALAFYCARNALSSEYKVFGPKTDDEHDRVENYLKKHPAAKTMPDGTYYHYKSREAVPFANAILEFLDENNDIKGLALQEMGEKQQADMINPYDPLGRQAIYVLKHMVQPNLP